MSYSNMSLTDLVSVNLNRMLFVKEYLKIISLYRYRFKNYLSVLIRVKQNKYPLKVKLRNNENIVVLNRQHLTPLLYGVDYNQEEDIVILDNLGYPARLFSATGNGELVPIFNNKDYDFLNVKGRTVIDIGANIADSSIYFALEDAEHVIALEPYPKNYQIAKKNIALNDLSSKITLLNAAGGAKDKEIFINTSYCGICKPLEASSTGENITIISLNTLVRKFNLNAACLKIDCEGCEYDMVLDASADVLKRFSRIQIEYHYGYKDLYNKLKQCGFKVQVTKPIYIKNELAKRRSMYVGYLYASQN